MSRVRVTAEQKRLVIERAQGVCEYCRSQAKFATTPFSIEHIVPRSAGGPTSLDNLALSCQGCNGFKYTKQSAIDPLSMQQVALFHPRQQTWYAHFTWSSDFCEIIGLTPTGRATLLALKLNRTELVNLRRILYQANLHPP